MFEKLLANCKKEDVIILPSLLVLGSYIETIESFLISCEEKQINLICIKEKIDSRQQKDFLRNTISLMSAISKIENFKIKQMMVKSKSDVVKYGRPPISEKKIEKIRHLHNNKVLTLREIAIACNVSVGTAFKYATKSQVDK